MKSMDAKLEVVTEISRVQTAILAINNIVDGMDITGDALDAASARAAIANEAPLLKRLQIRLDELSSALVNIEAGLFGVCLDCSDDIHSARMAARPTTSLCIDCQEAAEFHSRRHTNRK